MKQETPSHLLPHGPAAAVERTREAARGAEHFFDGNLWLQGPALSGIRQEMAVEHALPPTADGFNRLLEPGYLEVRPGSARCRTAVSYTHLTLPTICSV